MIVNFCAHSGIELIGVSRPLNSIKIMIKKNITNIVCWILSEILATATPNPEKPRIKRIVAK